MQGYSGTPLAKKLGMKAPMEYLVVGGPDEFTNWLIEIPRGVTLVTSTAPPIQAAHLFVKERSTLAEQLTELRNKLDQAGFVWISWPKKASGVATDITEDTIRDLALPMGYVDIKVCAVSDVWSGLKLVIRKSERRPST